MNFHIPFDTLTYSEELITAGVEPSIAKAQAKANAKLLASLIDNTLTTKADLNQTKQELETQLTEMKHQFEHRFKEMEYRFDNRFKEIDHRFKAIDHRFDIMEKNLIVKIGSLTAGLFAFFSTALGLIHWLIH